MPFNVIDKDGKHLGFVVGNNFVLPNSLLVALTDEECGSASLDLAKAKQLLAEFYGCTTFLGKANEQKLAAQLEKVWREDYQSKYGSFDLRLAIRLQMMKYAPTLNWSMGSDLSRVRGYIGLRCDTVVDAWKQSVVLEDDLSYLSQDALSDTKPGLHCQVVGYPTIRLEPIWFGGAENNHAHHTDLRLRTGNTIVDLSLPAQLPVKRGMSLVIYEKQGKDWSVLIDGALCVFRP